MSSAQFFYFCGMNFSSKLIEEAAEQMATLPGIGKKTALRLVLQLLRRSPESVERFANALVDMKKNIKLCANCFNLSDYEVCGICSNPVRDKSLICVVEDIRDVMAIEATEQYKGVYHVLGGIISPMDGVGPNDLHIEGLISRIESQQISEVILALSANMEGETTCFYLYKKLAPFAITISAIARGIGVGDELEYADELTLARSIKHRTPYENSLSR